MDTSEKNIDFTTDDGVRLAGTLLYPAGRDPYGSVLLFSGSGPQDRDETIAGKKPFLILSTALARCGYAVFRWDDRGVGASQGDYLAVSAERLAADGAQAMQRVQSELGFDRHVLVGHSQGALISTKLAALYPRSVSHLVLLAGMGKPGRVALLEQHENICRSEGWTDDEIDASLRLKDGLFDELAAAENRLASDEPKQWVLKELESKLLARFLAGAPLSGLTPDERAEVGEAVADLMEWEWRYLISVDPAHDLSNVGCPVFAMTGDRDDQVEASSNLAAIRRACENGRAAGIATHCLPDHNHLFQKTSGGDALNYGGLGEPFSQEAVASLLNWLERSG